jgi:hypothetical protein
MKNVYKCTWASQARRFCTAVVICGGVKLIFYYNIKVYFFFTAFRMNLECVLVRFATLSSMPYERNLINHHDTDHLYPMIFSDRSNISSRAILF